MGKIDIDQLCRDFEACLGWPYVTPGYNNERGIDCSGMFVRAYALQGEKIYHGSNTIWRNHMAEKWKIRGVSDLQKGMAVFKWTEYGDPQKDGQGNFVHVGLVTSVRPLRIVHASTEGKRVVKADAKLGKWQYCGYLLAGNYATKAELPGAYSPVSLPSNPQEGQNNAAMGAPTLRRGHKGDDVRRMQEQLAAAGYPLEADGIFGRQTLAAVKAFQTAHGLAVDGIVGRMTWKKLTGDGK